MSDLIRIDLISRQAAIDAIKRYESAYSYDLNNGLILAMNAVADVPTIETKRGCEYWDGESGFCALRRPAGSVKRGKWLLHEYPDGYYHTECSECGKVYDEMVYFLKKPNYCPNCGTRMTL